jgi:hypothetical protein
MRKAGRSTRRAALLALPFALWAAIPAMSWCSIGWDDVRTERIVRCAVGAAAMECTPQQGACDASACERMAADVACDADPTSEPSYPGGRAWCLDDTNGGTGVRVETPRVLPGWTILAVVTTALETTPPPASPIHDTPSHDARPPTDAPRRLPPSRAPPSLG